MTCHNESAAEGAAHELPAGPRIENSPRQDLAPSALFPYAYLKQTDGEARVPGSLEQKRHRATGLIESLRNDWGRIVVARSLERLDIQEHMRWCLEELTGLVRELEADDA